MARLLLVTCVFILKDGSVQRLMEALHVDGYPLTGYFQIHIKNAQCRIMLYLHPCDWTMIFQPGDHNVYTRTSLKSKAVANTVSVQYHSPISYDALMKQIIL